MINVSKNPIEISQLKKLNLNFRRNYKRLLKKGSCQINYRSESKEKGAKYLKDFKQQSTRDYNRNSNKGHLVEKLEISTVFLRKFQQEVEKAEVRIITAHQNISTKV